MKARRPYMTDVSTNVHELAQVPGNFCSEDLFLLHFSEENPLRSHLNKLTGKLISCCSNSLELDCKFFRSFSGCSGGWKLHK